MSVLVLLLVFAVVFSVAVAVILIAVLAVRASRRPAPPAVAASDPGEILRARFAAGEIDEDEYMRRMSALSQDW